MGMKPGPLRLGIIGCGWVTEYFHLQALQKVRNVEVVAAADEDQNRLKRVADQFRIPRRYSGHMALLKDQAVDAALVWLPADCQVDVSQDVLASAKHLILDKPLVFDLKVWDRLIEQAKQVDRTIMVVGFPRRWHPLMRRVREAVEGGMLGKVSVIRTVLTGKNAERRTIQELGARHRVRGVLFELGIHHFDVVSSLMPVDVEEIYVANSPDALSFCVTMRMTDGTMVNSTFSEEENQNDEIEIYGEAGRLLVSCYRFDGFEYVPAAVHPGDVKTRARRMWESLKELPQGLFQMRRGGNFADSYRAGWQLCVDAIRHGVSSDCTLVEARGALRLFLAAKESLDLGRPVQLAPRVCDRSDT